MDKETRNSHIAMVARVSTTPRTLNDPESNAVPISMVAKAYTPIGKHAPHHPKLNFNFVAIQVSTQIVKAIQSQKKAKPHMLTASRAEQA